MKLIKLSDIPERYKCRSLLKPLINLLRNQSGNVLIMVALLTTILFGMTALVVDAGMLYRERNILQKTVDAAALAGVQKLDGRKQSVDEAENTAREFVAYNYDGRVDEVLEENIICAFPVENKEYYSIQVTADIDTGLWFARVLSDKWKLPFNVSATATAIKAPGFGLMPIAIERTAWEELWNAVPRRPALGETLTIKGNKTTLDGLISSKAYASINLPGWFNLVGAIKGESELKNYISYGMAGCFKSGDELYSYKGATLGIKDPLQDRIDRADNEGCWQHPDGCPQTPSHIIDDGGTTWGEVGIYAYVDPIDVADDVFDRYKECPRLLLIPIVYSDDLIDKDKFKIDSFIIGYLDNTEGNDTVNIWFLGKLSYGEGSLCIRGQRYARLIH